MRKTQFHQLLVREVRQETADSISVSFEVPEKLREAYRFVPGQFLTLRGQIHGEELRRSYSVCSGSPDYESGTELRVAIKRVAGGRFSNWANDTLSPGERIDVMPPDGRFHVPLDAGRRKHHVGFAGGSGITPLLSLIKSTLAIEQKSEFTLIYGNRTVASIMFLEELEELKNRYMDRLRLHHVLSDEGHEIELLHGPLNESKCAQLIQALGLSGTIDEAFICGPEPMMLGAEKALLAAGVEAKKIHVERFGVSPASQVLPPPVAEDSRSAEVAIVIDGKQRRLKVPFDGQAILDAGLAIGADLPYACKAGVCCTCRARVLEGEVRMDKNYTLEQAEMQRGFVLTCQSHPVSERVVLSFDER